MGTEPNQPNQELTALKGISDSEKNWNEHQFGNFSDRSRFLTPNRRGFLAATAGVCLGTGIASTSIDQAAGANTGDHLLEITGAGSYAPYRFTVSENLEKSTANGGTISGEDRIFNQNRSVSGAVRGGTDAYTFDGDLVAFDLDGTVNVLLDGQPAHVGQRPDHFLQIQGQESYTTYSFTVSNNLEKSTAGGGTISGEDRIFNRNRSASGAVGSGTDAYTFDGNLRAFDFDGEVNVLLDGQPAHVGRLPDSVESTLPEIIWNRHYSNTRSATALARTPDGGYAFTTPSGLVKIDKAGQREWSRKYTLFEGRAIVRTTDGGFGLAGTWSSNGRFVKTNATGVEQWRREFQDRQPTTLVQLADGDYLVAGGADFKPVGNLILPTHGWAVELSPTGHIRWDRTFGSQGGNGFNAVVQTRDGGYLFGGQTGHGRDTYGDVIPYGWVLKTDGDGHQQWAKRYEYSDETFTSLIHAESGKYVLAGTHDLGGSLTKITDTGQVLWHRWFYKYDTVAVLNSIRRASDGGYVCVGSRQEADTSDEYPLYKYFGWILKTDGSGHQQWEKRVSPQGAVEPGYSDHEGYAFDVAGAQDGGYVFCGYGTTYPDEDGYNQAWVVKFADQ